MIDDFFRGLADGRKPETCRRYARARLRLYDFLDVDDMSRWLTDAEVTLLAAEREFDRDAALMRVFGVEGLLRRLPGSVSEAVLPSTAAEARMQVSVTARLLKHLRQHRWVDRTMARSFREATSAVNRARIDLDCRLAGRPPLPWDEIGARFRQQPGTQW